MNELKWIKSSKSNGSGGSNCVEVAQLEDGGVAIRDSKHPTVPALVFTRAEWEAFVAGVEAGEFR